MCHIQNCGPCASKVGFAFYWMKEPSSYYDKVRGHQLKSASKLGRLPIAIET